MINQKKTKPKSEPDKTKKAKSVLDDIDPFLDFKEWASAADEKAYKNL